MWLSRVFVETNFWVPWSFANIFMCYVEMPVYLSSALRGLIRSLICTHLFLSWWTWLEGVGVTSFVETKILMCYVKDNNSSEHKQLPGWHPSKIFVRRSPLSCGDWYWFYVVRAKRSLQNCKCVTLFIVLRFLLAWRIGMLTIQNMQRIESVR